MKVVELISPDMAKVSLGGIVKEVSIALLDEVKVGDYVVLHVGYALSKIDEVEAARTLALLATEEVDLQAEFGRLGAAS